MVRPCGKDGEYDGKRVYVGDCADSHSVGRPWKRWIDTMKVWMLSDKQEEWGDL